MTICSSRPGPGSRRRLVATTLFGFALLAPGFAYAVDPIDETDDAVVASVSPRSTPAPLVGTAPATARGLATGPAIARLASAETFRPAPMPNPRVGEPSDAVASDDGQASLHPDLLSMHEATAGALAGTSSEYEHSSRLKPAGGMSLSIPMD